MTLRPMAWGLEGAVAVVTGGGAGLGRASAEALAACGASVALWERDAGRAASAADALRSAGARVLAVPCDVTHADHVAEATSRVLAEFGRITHVVNNAGGPVPGAFTAGSQRDDERMWRRNLGSAALVTRACAPHLPDGGAVVNVTTVEAHRAAPGYAMYAAAKAGLLSLTRSLALELAPRVRVNAVAPDLAVTEGILAITGGRPPGAPHIPMGRPGRADEVAHAVVFLLSPLASYITGITLPVDGGTLAAGGWVPDGSGGYSLGGAPA